MEAMIKLHYLLRVFGCPVSSFPQTYIGLLVSDIKLKICDLQPLVSSDGYLDGLRGVGAYKTSISYVNISSICIK
jgi:hypothetical protein